MVTLPRALCVLIKIVSRIASCCRIISICKKTALKQCKPHFRVGCLDHDTSVPEATGYRLHAFTGICTTHFVGMLLDSCIILFRHLTAKQTPQVAEKRIKKCRRELMGTKTYQSPGAYLMRFELDRTSRF